LQGGGKLVSFFEPMISEGREVISSSRNKGIHFQPYLRKNARGTRRRRERKRHGINKIPEIGKNGHVWGRRKKPRAEYDWSGLPGKVLV